MHELPGGFRVAPNYRRKRVQGVEEEMRVDLSLQQLDLRLRQKPLLFLDLAGEHLVGKEARDAFSERSVE